MFATYLWQVCEQVVTRMFFHQAATSLVDHSQPGSNLSYVQAISDLLKPNLEQLGTSPMKLSTLKVGYVE